MNLTNLSFLTPNITTNTVPDLPITPWWGMLLIGLVNFVTVSANLLVIASFISEPRLRVPFNYYLLNLAISDLTVGLIGMPYYAIYTYYNYWPLNYAHCSFWMFFDFLGVSDSLWGMVAVSLDRVWAVTFPLTYRQHNSNRKAFLVIFLSRFLSVAALLPGYIGTRTNYEANSDPYVCDWNSDKLPTWASFFWVLALGEWIPILIAVVSYLVTIVRMGQIALHRKRAARSVAVHHMAAEYPRTRTRGRIERQAFLVLTLLITTVVTLWMPWFVYSAMKLGFGIQNDMFYTVSYWIAYAMSTVNPFLFNAASDEMRNTLRRLLHLRVGRDIASSSGASATHPS